MGDLFEYFRVIFVVLRKGNDKQVVLKEGTLYIANKR